MLARYRATKIARFAAPASSWRKAATGPLFKRLVRAILQRFPDITERQVEQAFDLLLEALAGEEKPLGEDRHCPSAVRPHTTASAIAITNTAMKPLKVTMAETRS